MKYRYLPASKRPISIKAKIRAFKWELLHLYFQVNSVTRARDSLTVALEKGILKCLTLLSLRSVPCSPEAKLRLDN